MNAKQERNELCACGSGKKYKKCCGLIEAKQAGNRSVLLKSMQQGSSGVYKDLTKSLFKVIKGKVPGMPHPHSGEEESQDLMHTKAPDDQHYDLPQTQLSEDPNFPKPSF